ncbi:ROK family protein [Cohnella cellulosilytica]|uniref:ROK family protein n=1 Tax=Cohnella cellulosilytica TaxID=986710 RepID=A0ABW2FIW6_9BACL
MLTVIAIVLDFGGTNIKLGIAREGRMLAGSRLAAYSGSGLLPRLNAAREAVLDLLARTSLTTADCGGVAIALPGIVDPVRRTLLSINEKYADATGFAFEQWARESFGLRLEMENDARAALLGETAYGIARGETNAVLMTFGTGIGTAALMNGRIVRGRHYQAGILGGHMATDAYGEICTCGNVGCLEAQASHWSLPAWLVKQDGYRDSALAGVSDIGYRSVVEASAANDPFAVRAMRHLLVHWSAGIVNLIHAYDPDLVVLSGGLMKSRELVVPELSRLVRERAWTPWGDIRIAASRDPDSSVLLGLSHLLERSDGHDAI